MPESFLMLLSSKNPYFQKEVTISPTSIAGDWFCLFLNFKLVDHKIIIYMLVPDFFHSK